MLLQTKLTAEDFAALERYQSAQRFPTSKAAIVRYALRELIQEQEDMRPRDDPEPFSPFPDVRQAEVRP